MSPQQAFATPLTATAFKGLSLPSALSTAPQCRTAAFPIRRAPRMADDEKKPLFSNPFAKKPQPQQSVPTSSFTEPQPGDPGYKAPQPKVSPKAEVETEAKTDTKVAQKSPAIKLPVVKLPVVKLPVFSGENADKVKRGLDLLREDLLKNAPEIAGVGRQDADSVVMKPVAGEPGFKPQSFQTVKVSELGISPFPDDKNAVGKVGGIAAVKKAAIDVKAGKSAKEIKMDVLKIAKVEVEQTVFDIPDYLKPIPEDTPRKGMTWKNYVGR